MIRRRTWVDRRANGAVRPGAQVRGPEPVRQTPANLCATNAPTRQLPAVPQASVSLDGRNLCDKHDYTDYKAKWLAVQQDSAAVEEL